MPRLGELPNSLKKNADFLRLGDDVPVMLVRPEAPTGDDPLFIWMHGRTTHKSFDPGRFLRLMRSGIATCSIDLPGHGERLEGGRDEPEAIIGVILQMVEELDAVLLDLDSMGEFDQDRIGIGGISAGGIVTLLRLTQPHRFSCAAVEATTGNRSFRNRGAFPDTDALSALDVMPRIDGWREIPILGLHNRHDEWIDAAGQELFFESLRERYERPELAELHVYEELTGAPHEHSGFGRQATDAKNRQVEFLARTLRPTT